MTLDRVTVAICTWNRAKLLRVTLDALCQQELPPGLIWEVLVVDNNSPDDTAAVVQTFADKLPIRYLFEGRQGKSYALNRVLDESTSDWVVFTDDDVRLPAGWLAAYVREAAEVDPDVAFLGGPVVPWFETPPDPNLAEALPEVRGGFCAVVLPDDPEIHFDTGLPVGANCALHMKRLAGQRFDPRLGPSGDGRIVGEESKLFRGLLSAGLRGRWVPDAVLEHYVIPARLHRSHLCRTMFDMGRMHVLTDGRPVGMSVMGVPLWAMRQFVASLIHASGNRLVGRKVDCYRELASAARRAGLAWQCYRGVPAHAD